ncbi:MAG TPA: OmpA family protein [Puia sp.]|nr:OmpA family protein [Puia sp.]
MDRVPAWSQISRDTVLVIYFREDSYRPESRELKKIGSFFSFHKDVRVSRVEGHTDTVGAAGYNIRLSRQRSGAVFHYLKEQLKIQEDYPVLSYGEERPADGHDNALNRRVEIGLEWRGTGAVAEETPVTAAGNGNGGVEKRERTGVVLEKYNLDGLYFQPDIAVLENYSLAYIHSMALILKKYKEADFEIRGHVNCPLSVKAGSGYMEKMNQLSVERAKVVYGLLIEEGIPAGRMSYRGLGNTEMLYPRARTDEEKRKNMRVEVLVIQTSSSPPSPQ